MRICTKHWTMMRAAVDRYGMSDLVAKDGETVLASTVAELEGETTAFDPLMSMHWHYMNTALEAGGLYLLAEAGPFENDGHYCPVCEFAANVLNYDAAAHIESIAQQIAAHCRDQGLISKVS